MRKLRIAKPLSPYNVGEEAWFDDGIAAGLIGRGAAVDVTPSAPVAQWPVSEHQAVIVPPVTKPAYATVRKASR